VSATLSEAVARALRGRELGQAFEVNGAVPTASSPGEFRAFLEHDIALNKKAIAVAGVQPE
jgi:tripartite-type tricarboxylate transporter receptor subunit TctC